MKRGKMGSNPYDRFHMTSRRPHWVQKNEMAAMLVFQKTFVGIELFSHVKTFFYSKKFA